MLEMMGARLEIISEELIGWVDGWGRCRVGSGCRSR